MKSLHKLKMACAAGVLLVVTCIGLETRALRPQAVKESEPPADSPDDKPMSIKGRVDLYGDPLPEGAVMRLGTLQRRAVMAQLAVSPDGQAIVSVRGGKHIQIWDAATGRLLQRRELLLDSSVLSPTLSRDGRWLATGRWGRDRNLTIWDTRNGEKVRELLLRDTDALDHCAFAPDSSKLVAAGHRGEDHFVRVWNLADGKLLFGKAVRAAACHLAAIAPDGKRILAQFVPREGKVFVSCWEIGSSRQLWRSEDFRLDPLTFLPDGNLVAWNPKPLPVNLAAGQPAKITLPPGVRQYSRMVFSSDGRTLLISDPAAYSDVTVWDWREGKQLRVLTGMGEAVFLPDGKSVVTNNGSLQRWDLASGKAVWPDTFALGHTNAVTAVAFTADGRRLVSGSRDGSVRLWDVKTGKQRAIWGGYERPSALANGPWTGVGLTVTPDGNRLLSTTQYGVLQLRDTRTGECLRSFSLPRTDVAPPGNWPLYRIRLSLDETKVFALAGSEFFPGYYSLVGGSIPTNWLAVWDLKTGQLLRRRPVPWEAKAISPDGRQVLLANGILLDAETGKEITRMEGMAVCGAGAFSPDGALILGGFNRGIPQKDSFFATTDAIRVWETATGKVVSHLQRKTSEYAKNVLMDGRFIALNEGDGFKLWDLFGGEAMAGPRIPQEAVASSRIYVAPHFAFSPDGRRLAAGLPDSTILLWDLPKPRATPHRLRARELESLWADLADADAVKAWRAVGRMAHTANDAVSFLRGRVKPYPTAAADVTNKLLADLDSDSFARREAAMRQLKKRELQAEPALRAALKAQPTLEQRRRIEDLLAALPVVPPPSTPEELRQLRALVVLECIGSAEARRLLKEVADGPQSVSLTRQARAALACMPE